MQAYFWAGESCLFIVEFTRSPSLILSPWKNGRVVIAAIGAGVWERERCRGGGGGGGGGAAKKHKNDSPNSAILLQFYMAFTSAEIFAHPKKTPV